MQTEVFWSTVASGQRIAGHFVGFPVYDQSLRIDSGTAAKTRRRSHIVVISGTLHVSQITVRPTEIP